MLKFSTEIKTLDIDVDGQTYSIPLEPTVQDFDEAAELFSTEGASTAEFARWFLTYLKRYVPNVELLPMTALSKIMKEWSDKSELTKGQKGK
ncbi:hypothetical protein [Atopobium deltae]|uniref:Tail assembly chaperone n=1 Tax=Atopobium deltae TaxID=1393034 RepID=A0A133XTX4_9ACTN|nr:hypothetical protein [Atopobium deltae]KXB34378.1 hypothetical protein HMPREF3192_00930 [Atopobium deltae]